MICLDKADDDAGRFKHLAWNQSPPALAPAHTTRQDLNGIANLREYVAAGQDGGGGGGAIGGAAGDDAAGGDRTTRGAQRPDPAPASGAGRRFAGPSSRLKAAAVGGDGHAPRLLRVPSSRGLERLYSWTTWILSVLFTAYLLSSPLPSLANWNRLPSAAADDARAGAANVTAAAQPPLLLPDRPPSSAPAALARRASTCKVGGVDGDEYNMPLHAGALVIIWFVSTLGCAFPILARKVPGLRIPRRFFFAVRHFGTGVLIATAFVHLLPTAFVSLGNPCLGGVWAAYEPMPGAIALAAIFLVTVIEMVFHPSRHVPPGGARPAAPAGHMCSGTAMLPFGGTGPLNGRSSSVGQGLSQLDQDAAAAEHEDARRGDDSNGRRQQQQQQQQPKPDSDNEDGTDGSLDGPQQLSPDMKRRKERLQCILLEMGILFHSVFIGMALSVSVGGDFIVLLIAIVFHQTFEGLALGSRIAAIEWERRRWQPWLMALAYGCTTPLGQAIGLATHTLYSPDSEVGLVLVGVMNAVSAGLLTFASLVELLSEDFLSDESWRHLRGRRRVVACVLVFFGAFFMSLVGAWA